MKGLEEYTETPEYPPEFGAKIFKISRDAQGNRMSHMKITGGSLSTREIIDEEKVNQIRLYSGREIRDGAGGIGRAPSAPCWDSQKRFRDPGAGDRSGLGHAALRAGDDIPDRAAGGRRCGGRTSEVPGAGGRRSGAASDMGGEQEGDPCPDYGRDSDGDFKSVIEERFGLSVEFGDRSIVYRETITNTVEWRGAFRTAPSLRGGPSSLEPGEPGERYAVCFRLQRGYSGKKLAAAGSDPSGGEKEHKGVLTGSSVTDMKITLMSGRAHLKHTEGGDFRQAVYRAVRQGLMQAESMLLEPFYDFRLELPDRYVGRAMSDVERMAGESDASCHGGRPGGSHRKRPSGLYGGISERGNRLYGRRGTAVIYIFRLQGRATIQRKWWPQSAMMRTETRRTRLGPYSVPTGRDS